MKKSIIIILCVFSVMLILNMLMPIHRDDYDYSVIWGTSQHIASLSDVVSSCYNHYMTHGGRIVAFFFYMYLLPMDKLYLDVINTCFFVGIVSLIYLHGIRKLDLFTKPVLLLVSAVLCWLCFPHFGEVAVWKCGSAVYLWTGTMAALFLLPYNLFMAGNWHYKGIFLTVLMFVLGIISGWSVENIAVTVLVLSAGIAYYNHKRGLMESWMISGAIGVLIGLIGLLAAPGNYVRYDAQGSEEGEGLFITMIHHINNQFGGNGEMLLYVLPAFLILWLSWRIVYAKVMENRTGMKLMPNANSFGKKRMLYLGFILLTTVSYFTTGFVGKTIHDIIEGCILIPLGFTRSVTLHLFANTMSGFDEMAVYWLFILFMYSYLKEAIGLTPEVSRKMKRQVGIIDLTIEYPVMGYVIFLVLMAFFNNLVMLAAPTFPVRATFSSVIFIISAVVAVFNMPVVSNVLLANPVKKILVGTVVFLTSFTVLSAVYIAYNINEHNKMVMDIIENASANHEKYVSVPPLLFKDRALRHVYFEDYYNGVSQDGLKIYYDFDKLEVVPMPPWKQKN